MRRLFAGLTAAAFVMSLGSPLSRKPKP